ncbi:hypothetical protein HPS36_01720 [Halorubrum salinarum]|uniref:Uncharacterized protein n=1 Tax=Halorubrum salinarum TaxID=2739057 RepID=A0A7D4CXH3_9EURY|nr:hypothetical protein [Halorubrum salinarum]QKG91623.1 hypothetical protein HPS36_01720 [Halorubrum salinarum]
MLTDAEERLVEGILDAGEAVERDTFEFMIAEGLPAEQLQVLGGDGDVEAVIESLEAKGLVATEPVEETVRDAGSVEDSLRIPGTDFERVERRYVHFTAKLEAKYRE